MAGATGPRHRGIVKWFNDEKGYGFILRDDEPDLFVHWAAITAHGRGHRTLTQGQTVDYDIVDGRKGPEASAVEVVA